MEAAGGVGHHHGRAPGGSRLHGVIDHRGRVGAGRASHDPGPGPVGPGGQLLGGRGPEGVAGGQHHPGPVAGLPVGQLADGGGLAHPVDPHEQPDRGSVAAGVNGQRAVIAPEPLHQLGPQRLQHPLGLFDPLGGGRPAPGPGDHLGSGRRAHIGPDQRLGEPAPSLLRRRPRPDRSQRLRQQGSGPGQPTPQRPRAPGPGLGRIITTPRTAPITDSPAPPAPPNPHQHHRGDRHHHQSGRGDNQNQHHRSRA